MKDIKGWISLAVFAIVCYVIGVNRYLMKSVNITVIAMLVISVALVVILNSKKGEETEETQESK
ncbi:MAG: hypothetical protein AB7G87_08700 [Clostridia bacterium]